MKESSSFNKEQRDSVKIDENFKVPRSKEFKQAPREVFYVKEEWHSSLGGVELIISTNNLLGDPLFTGTKKKAQEYINSVYADKSYHVVTTSDESKLEKELFLVYADKYSAEHGNKKILFSSESKEDSVAFIKCLIKSPIGYSTNVSLGNTEELWNVVNFYDINLRRVRMTLSQTEIYHPGEILFTGTKDKAKEFIDEHNNKKSYYVVSRRSSFFSPNELFLLYTNKDGAEGNNNKLLFDSDVKEEAVDFIRDTVEMDNTYFTNANLEDNEELNKTFNLIEASNLPVGTEFKVQFPDSTYADSTMKLVDVKFDRVLVWVDGSETVMYKSLLNAKFTPV